MKRAACEAGVYPLSPMQEGMLFHTLSAPHSGCEIEQLVADLREPLDVDALRDAWQQVFARHAILRTRFRWQGLERPVQEVAPDAVLPWVQQDWSESGPDDREELFQRFLEADRRRGFEPDQPPLLRLTLLRVGGCHYRLVWTFHHALLDGRSISLVLREVLAIYDSGRRPGVTDLPSPRPYRDYIDWLQHQDWTRSEAFWRERLQGFVAPTPLIMAGANGRGRVHVCMQGEQETRLSRELTGSLRALADRLEVTLNTVVQGAWALLLGRCSREEEVVFGATRACRRSTVAGGGDMVGLFINTLPLRVGMDANTALGPWLQELRRQWVAMREHEHTPLAKVQGWSDVPSGASLFETIVVFENESFETALRAQGGPWLNREFRLLEQPVFPLVLAACGGEELRLKLEFDAARFDVPAVERMLGHLRALFEGMTRGPDQRLGQLSMLTAEERRHLVVEWNEPQIRCPVSAGLHQLFEARAERAPEAVALVWEGRTLTYRELNARANRLAHTLRKQGVGPDVLVALCVERSFDLVTGILAVLKAGGAYVPIDLDCPRERVEFILADCRAPVILTQEKLAPGLSSHPAHVICIDTGHEDADTRNLPAVTTADHLAYVIYTSGSTGRPKGVMVSHRNVVRLFQATREWFRFDETDVWTLFHSCAFDFSVWELWGALLHGGRLVIVPHVLSRSPSAFLELLSNSRVTVLNQTPSAFRQLMQADERAGAAGALALRWVIFGGEALDPQSLRPWFKRHGDQYPRLVNMYGITETTVHVTYRPLRAYDVDAGSVIGVPIPDLQVYLLDRYGQPVPLGVPGEIHVGGAGLARGYLHHPELTAEKFVANPFSEDPAARLYKTGDLARHLPGRDLEYLGRIDDQLKIRGFRIEPAEIESALGEHPAVAASVVVAREDKPGDQRLVAYLVGRKPAPLDDDLRHFLKARLPDYMIPSAFVVLPALPLTTNGKIDRRALPAPGPDYLAARRVNSPPHTRLERQLACIWRDLLGAGDFNLDDNFFEMGGHSLLLVQLQDRLRAAFDREVPISVLFQHPTISSLARHLGGVHVRPHAGIEERARRMQALQELHA